MIRELGPPVYNQGVRDAAVSCRTGGRYRGEIYDTGESTVIDVREPSAAVITWRAAAHPARAEQRRPSRVPTGIPRRREIFGMV